MKSKWPSLGTFVNHEFRTDDIVTWLTGRGYTSKGKIVDPQPRPGYIKVVLLPGDSLDDVIGHRRLYIKKAKVTNVSGKSRSV